MRKNKGEYIRLVEYCDETIVTSPEVQLINYDKQLRGKLKDAFVLFNDIFINIMENDSLRELTCTVELSDGCILKIRLCEFLIHLIIWMPEIRESSPIGKEDVLIFQIRQ